MKALSIKQPWAWLICAGFKDIENRDWKIGRNPQHGQYKSQRADFGLTLPCRIYVHAGKGHDFTPETNEFLANLGFVFHPDDMDGQIAFGAIIGEVDITGCVEQSESPWFTGRYGFTLAKPKLYDEPVPWRGQLGFFEVTLPNEVQA